MDRAIKKKWLAEGEAACRDHFVLTFELLSNQVYPMPGMADIIATFQKHNIPLGIVSNAQFYRRLL
ncbi:MAG: hypothetical protein U5L09_02495 [Bacteroidales bacterium]|nr:hypothetical protein [Bacteroidales bacterium]